MHALRYAFEEAAASLWRGRHSGLLSTATIAVALFVLGVFLLATSNLERLSREWSRTAELSVYLDDEATPEDRSAIERLVAPGVLVAGHEYVSKAEALKRFKQTFADLATQTDSLEGNPMPASYEVRLNASATAPGPVEELAARLRQSPGVADVRYDREWLDRLLSAVTVIRGVGLALSAILTIAAALTVANVVRLALHARRDEVEIMQLVGAPTVYIRGPFVMEGVLQGGIGAIAALALLAALFLAV
jgi:cell division transport system permease protein